MGASKHGFTLVELLVVISIIGVLAAVLFLGLNPLTQFKKARDGERKSDLRQIKTALAVYYNVHGTYPTGSGQIVGCVATPPSACAWGNEWSREGVVFMRILPGDPLSTQSYTYSQTESGRGFDLLATLEIDTDPDIAESQTRCGVGAPGQYVVCED